LIKEGTIILSGGTLLRAVSKRIYLLQNLNLSILKVKFSQYKLRRPKGGVRGIALFFL